MSSVQKLNKDSIEFFLSTQTKSVKTLNLTVEYTFQLEAYI